MSPAADPAFASPRVYAGSAPSSAASASGACALGNPANGCTHLLVACPSGLALYAAADSTYPGTYRRDGARLLLTLASPAATARVGAFAVSLDGNTLTAERDGVQLTLRSDFTAAQLAAGTCSG